MNVGREVHGGSILNLHEKQKPPRELPHDGFRFSSHNMVGEMRTLYHCDGVEVNGAKNEISGGFEDGQQHPQKWRRSIVQR